MNVVRVRRILYQYLRTPYTNPWVRNEEYPFIQAYLRGQDQSRRSTPTKPTDDKAPYDQNLLKDTKPAKKYS